ncbi:MAG: BamA/TamA family outer membrane protein [Gemmatimonadota bacterium]
MRNGMIGFTVAIVLLTPIQAAQAQNSQNAPKPSDHSATMVKAPGPQYATSPFGEFFVGANWRDIWAMPVRVPILNLGRFAGGLKPTEEGGNQSRTLRFKGADGQTYIFRSTDKFMRRALPSDFQDTPIGSLMQDASSSLHPTGALVVAPLQEVAGLLQAVPTLVILPNDPRLGEFREKFGGTMGQLELRPDEVEDGVPAFANALKISGTEKLLEELEQNLDNRLDSRDYLSARLVDFLIGDSDRGADQWRFARFDQGELRTWRPIPRDRDYAFMSSQGMVGFVGKMVVPKLLNFTENMPKLGSLTFMTQDFDRSHLVDLPWAAWDSIVTRIETGLTDDAIRAAVNRLPEEHRARSARIVTGLRARRTQLRATARDYYNMVSQEADVFGSNADDRAEIERQPDGSVDVRLFSKKSGDQPRLMRRFHPAETREVRVYLQDGDDQAIVRGSSASGIKVRVTGGAGADVLVDSSRVAGSSEATVFYDASGKNRIEGGPSTRISLKEFETLQPIIDPEADPPPKEPEVKEERRGVFQDLQNNNDDYLSDKTSASTTRFWGERGGFSPVLDYGEGAGLIVGAGVSHKKYGFRHSPFENRAYLNVLYGVSSGGFGADGFAQHHFENSSALVNIRARATQFESNRFYGFGNDTELIDRRTALVLRDEVSVHPAIGWGTGESRFMTIGPVVRYLRAHPREDSPASADLPGASAPYGQAGIQMDLEADHRVTGETRTGYALRASVSGFPALWDVNSAYARANVEGLLYIPLSWPTLALRGGAARVFGNEFPLHDAAFLGGRQTLRGYRFNRLAGDTEVHAGAELQLPVGEITIISRTRVGVFGVGDIGRVWFDGDSAGKWHNGVGGGLWLETLRQTVSVTYAHGEENRLYLQFGWPF